VIEVHSQPQKRGDWVSERGLSSGSPGKLPIAPMAAATQTPAPGEIACPDPTVHEHHSRQSAAASTAALYAAHPERNKDSPLGPDGKLSSRSELHVVDACHDVSC
jgi:hypothetical protein